MSFQSWLTLSPLWLKYLKDIWLNYPLKIACISKISHTFFSLQIKRFLTSKQEVQQVCANKGAGKQTNIHKNKHASMPLYDEEWHDIRTWDNCQFLYLLIVTLLRKLFNLLSLCKTKNFAEQQFSINWWFGLKKMSKQQV